MKGMLNLSARKEQLRRKHISEALKRIGHKPKIRGGNGTGPTKAETALIEMLSGAVWNYGIHTGKWNGSGYPPIYKVDCALPAIKLAIEADGNSHCSSNRKSKDRKKQEFLAGLGWTVLRFSNRAILDARTSAQVLRDIRFTISKLKSTQVTA